MNSTTNVKSVNILAVLQVIQAEKKVSAARLSQKTGLSIMTVGKLLALLCAEGVCTSDGAQQSAIGRKALLYTLNPDYGVILGLRLRRSALEVIAEDFAGGMLHTAQLPCNPSDLPGSVQLLRDQITAAKERWESRLLGVGVSVPGRATPDGHIVSLPEYPVWDGLSLPEQLGASVWVENDSNALALAVKWLGRAGDAESFVYLIADEGLGAGIVSDSRLFTGAHARSGEIGHTTVDPEGPLCRCGRRGCLQAYLTEEPHRAARYIGIAAANMTSLFDPELLFVQSELLSEQPALLKEAQAVCPVPFTLIHDQTLISSASVCIVFERLFSGEILQKLGL